jgi:hypothetical protein
MSCKNNRNTSSDFMHIYNESPSKRTDAGDCTFWFEVPRGSKTNNQTTGDVNE